MRSESLVRLDVPSSFPSASAAAARQSELEHQKAEFFAKGGRIEEVEGFSGGSRAVLFNSGTVVLGSQGPRLAAPTRVEVDGRWLLKARRAAKVAGRSECNMRKMARTGLFPKPVPGVKPHMWDEEEVLAWAKANPKAPRVPKNL